MAAEVAASGQPQASQANRDRNDLGTHRRALRDIGAGPEYLVRTRDGSRTAL
jgi:hypothetical protein